MARRPNIDNAVATDAAMLPLWTAGCSVCLKRRTRGGVSHILRLRDEVMELADDTMISVRCAEMGVRCAVIGARSAVISVRGAVMSVRCDE
jgi:hypothetical protein